MVELRIIAPAHQAGAVLELLGAERGVGSVVHLRGAAHTPAGDVIVCDVADERASELIACLRELRIDRDGAIILQPIEAAISRVAEQAQRAVPGREADAVVWEGLEARTSEEAELSVSYLVFMALATLIAAVGIFLNTTVLIVGAMIVGPDFGPVAGTCVAVLDGQWNRAARSLSALLIGFPLAIVVAYLATLAFRALGTVPAHFAHVDHSVASAIANPGFFSVFVALLAGIAGTLSLSTAKSGALIGVLVSVTTIPAAAEIAVAGAYRHWSRVEGSLEQLAINIGGLLLAGTVTLLVQRNRYRRRSARPPDTE